MLRAVRRGGPGIPRGPPARDNGRAVPFRPPRPAAMALRVCLPSSPVFWGQQARSYASQKGLSVRKSSTPAKPKRKYSNEPEPEGETDDFASLMDPARKAELLSRSASSVFYPSKEVEQASREVIERDLEGKSETQLLEKKYTNVLTKEDVESMESHVNNLIAIMKAPLTSPAVERRERRKIFTDDLPTYFSKYPRNVTTYERYIWGCATKGKMEEARAGLEDMKKHDIPRTPYHYTSLMLGCVVNKDPDAAFKILDEMKQDNVEVVNHTISVLVDACVAANQLDRAYDVVEMAKEKNIKPSVEVFTSLIRGCIKIDKDYERAWATFDHMRVWHAEPDNVCFTIMIQVAAREGKVERAMTLLDDLKTEGHRPTEVTYNSLIEACAKRPDFYKDMYKILAQMKDDGFAPDRYTLTNILIGCARGGDAETGELIFDELMRTKEGPTEEHAYALMMGTYSMANRADFKNAAENIAKGEKIWERMLGQGIKPTHHSLEARLALYTRAFRLNRAIEIKDSWAQYGVPLNVKAYNYLIDMFQYAHRVERAFDMFNLMKLQGIAPNKLTYVKLIEACTRTAYFQSGMKIVKEMRDQGFHPEPRGGYILNFRRRLMKHPHIVRELDKMTGKEGMIVLPWNRAGPTRKKIVYKRDLTDEEMKRSPLYS